jgi:hypothetical protein
MKIANITLYILVLWSIYGCVCKLSLAQVVSFFMVELTYPDLNIRFDMSVTITTNYSFSDRWCLRQQ